ncbi:MAG: O-antigen ligase family protein [Oligoflexales bacterium]
MEANVTKRSHFENILFTFVFFSILLPPGAQYLLLLVVLIRTIVCKQGSPWKKVVEFGGKRFVYGLTLNLATLGALAVVWVIREPMLRSDVVSDYAHVMAKQFLWPLIMVWTLVCAHKRGWRLDNGLVFLVSLLVVHLSYVLAQRYFGIDWVHGLDAVLPGNRFAYGVYRVSGFMSHPLNLAYNLMLFCLMAYFFAFRMGPSKNSRLWALVFGLASLTLVVTVSRFATLLTIAVIFLWEFKRIREFKKVALGALAAIVLILAVEQSTIRRISELSLEPSRMAETMPRIGFWKIHWQMFTDHPLLGVGLHNRVSASLDYYNRAGYTEKEDKYRAHNIFLQTLADSGIVGFAGLIAFLLGLCGLGYHGAKNSTRLFLVVFLATLACGFVDNILRDSEFVFALFYVLIISKLSLLDEGETRV